MGVNDTGQIFGTTTELHHGHRLGNQIGSAGAYNMNSQQSIVLGVGNDLDEPVGLPHALRSRGRQ